LDPIRQRRSRYEQNPDLVWEVLEKGRQKVLFEAEKTMQMVRQGMKIDY
jgi:tryptophanyl-tRNA synthetase